MTHDFNQVPPHPEVEEGIDKYRCILEYMYTQYYKYLYV